MNEGIVIEVYKHNNLLEAAGYLRGRREPKYIEQLKDVEAGSLLISRDDPGLLANPSFLDGRNILKYRVDTNTVGAIIIQRIKSVTIQQGDKTAEYYEVSGPGLKGWFDDAILYPWGGFKTSSKDARYFSFSSPQGTWYNGSDWAAPYKIYRAKPKQKLYAPTNWPDSAINAWWVWGTDGSQASTPPGTNYFRFSFTAPVNGEYVFYVAADDNYTVYIDGEEIAHTSDPINNWQEAKKVNVTLSAGNHIAGFRVTNVRSQAGLIVALYRTVPQVPQVNKGVTTFNVTTDIVTANVHGLTNGTKVYFTTAGTLPGGLEPNKDYFIRDVTANTFKLARSSGGPVIDLTGSQNGAHTLWVSSKSEYDILLAYTGMSAADLNGQLTQANNTVALRYNTWVGLPAGNPKGNNTQKKQAKAKADAFAIYQKALQAKALVQKEYDAAVAAEAAGFKWEVNAYPAKAPGWNAGQVIKTLIAEGAARGIRSMETLVPTFSDTKDSNGEDWPPGSEWAFNVGDSYANIFSKMEEIAVDIWIDPHSYQLYAATTRGRDRTELQGGEGVFIKPTIFRRGKNLRGAEFEARSKIKNNLSIKTELGWLETPSFDTPSITKYGRLETAIDTGSTEAISRSLALIVMKQRATQEEGASYDVVLDTEDVPWATFRVGDWVLAPDKNDFLVKRRIVSISLEEGETGETLYSIEFDTIFKTNEDRINNIMDKIGGGGVGGGYENIDGIGSGPPGGSTPLPPSEIGYTIIDVPLAPTDLDVFSIGNWSSNGVTPLSQLNLSWSPVTQTESGDDIIPAEYEVWGRLTAEESAGFQLIATVSEPKATVDGFTPGTNWTFKVNAWSEEKAVSEFSPTISHEMAGPDEPLVAPDAPELSSDMGIITVKWNGLLSGNPPPPQFRFVYAEISTAQTGQPWLPKGAALMRESRQTTITDGVRDNTYWVRLRAVDGLGMTSEPSPSASIKVAGVDLGDLDQSVQDAIDAAKRAGEEARGQLNMLSDPSFELGTSEFWSLTPPTVYSTVQPRTGVRHLNLGVKTTAYTGATYQKPIPVDEGEQYYFRVMIRPGRTMGDGDLVLGVRHGPNESVANTATMTPLGYLPTGNTYQMFAAQWTVPAGTKFIKPTIGVGPHTTTTPVYRVDDARFYRMTDEAVIVNGAITTDKLAAGAVVAETIAAAAIATEHLQAGAVDTEKLQAGAVVSESIAAGAILADHIGVGVITAGHLQSGIGNSLDISSNESINIIAGNISGVQDSVNANEENLAQMQTIYQFGPTGALISAPGSVYQLSLSNDGIDMLENGIVVSNWNAGTMTVTQFVGERVTLGNHQLEKYAGGGTVVRAL